MSDARAMKELIQRQVNSLEEDVIRWRRHLHSRPELSFEEFETSDFIAERLEEMGYSVRRGIGGTGLSALLDTGRDGPVIAFRADMDALPILEDTGLPFESRRSGIMHGCGHDAHMAVLLGTAGILMSLKDHLSGRIKFIFQPGEEANGGARCMINDEVLQDPPVSGIFALHVIPELPVGTIGIRSGHLSATDDCFNIRVTGRGAHSSEPREGINAILIASHIVVALQSILNCNLSPFDVATLSVCIMRAGEAENIIPESAEIQGMIRCVEKKDKLVIRERMTTIAANTAAGFGGQAEVEFIDGYPSVHNDPDLTETVIRAGREMLGAPEDVLPIPRPHMGSEDFAYFQEEIPGAMFMLGCGVSGEDRGALHTASLDIHEDALSRGVKVFSRVASLICGNDSGNDTERTNTSGVSPGRSSWRISSANPRKWSPSALWPEASLMISTISSILCSALRKCSKRTSRLTVPCRIPWTKS